MVMVVLAIVYDDGDGWGLGYKIEYCEENIYEESQTYTQHTTDKLVTCGRQRETRAQCHFFQLLLYMTLFAGICFFFLCLFIIYYINLMLTYTRCIYFHFTLFRVILLFYLYNNYIHSNKFK